MNEKDNQNQIMRAESSRVHVNGDERPKQLINRDDAASFPAVSRLT